MDKIRIGLFFRDNDVVKENLEVAKKMVEEVNLCHARSFA